MSKLPKLQVPPIFKIFAFSASLATIVFLLNFLLSDPYTLEIESKLESYEFIISNCTNHSLKTEVVITSSLMHDNQKPLKYCFTLGRKGSRREYFKISDIVDFKETAGIPTCNIRIKATIKGFWLIKFKLKKSVIVRWGIYPNYGTPKRL